MKNILIDAELQDAKRFHGHLGPYLIVGMRMGHFISAVFGDEPFSYRIHSSVGWKPPPSCVIDGLQITTPCTVGNSMIQVEDLQDIAAWAENDAVQLSLRLRPAIRDRIDRETTKENEESLAQELWQTPAEELFIIEQIPA